MNDCIEPRQHQESPLRVAVLSESDRYRSLVRQALTQQGLEVVADRTLTAELTEEPVGQADALLVDVEHVDEQLLSDGLRRLDAWEAPVLYHESGPTGGRVADVGVLGRRLAKKLQATASAEDPASRSAEGIEPMSSASTPGSEVCEPARSLPEQPEQVWVLGASIGGPQAIKRFLAALPRDVNAHFVVAQHIGGGFVELLADQLNRSTALPVRCAQEGLVLEHGAVTLVPVDREFRVDGDACIRLPLLAHPGPYTPSIDSVFMEVATRFGTRAGAIIMSGMGNDGLMGCKQVARSGGAVWVQESDSCVVPSMPEHVQQLGLADGVGTPEALAERIINRAGQLPANRIGGGQTAWAEPAYSA